MNLKFTVFVLFPFLTFAAAGAQIASHAPALKPAPMPAASDVAPMVATLKPVANVNGTVLTETDLVREEYAIFPYARQHNGLPKELEPEIRQGAMRMMIFEELVYQEAVRRKMTVLPAHMQRAEMDFRKTFSNPEEYNAFMQSEFHGSQKMLDDKIRRSLLIDQMLKIEIQSKSAVTVAEAFAYYDKNPDHFKIPESFIFQTITAIAPDNATPDQVKAARAKVEKALPEARAAKTNNDFGLLAEKVSEDDYRVMEGQHQSTTVDQIPPQVVQALKSMKVGDVSGVVQIGDVFTILRLNAHTPAGKEKFEAVRAKLQKDMQQKKTNDLRATLDQKLRKNAQVEEP
jgi:peptidyl-prolyl cis-trans isomerase SurA